MDDIFRTEYRFMKSNVNLIYVVFRFDGIAPAFYPVFCDSVRNFYLLSFD